jgi:hypothetical protein
MSAVTKPNLVTAPQKINISVGPGGVPVVDQDPVVVNRDSGPYEIEWIGPDGVEYTVCFVAESPFDQRHFHRLNRRSGFAKTGATGRYKYNVEIDGKILDPTIIIKP